MTDKGEWEGGVGRAWACEWERTDRSFARLTPSLFAAMQRLAGRDIVDIGCGAGQLALGLADARPEARVLGIDISPDLVAAATIRAQGRPNCAFALADAATWEPDRGAPDLYVSRHGVMFFQSPEAAFAHLAEVAVDGALMCFSCFRSVADNPWVGAVSALLPQPMADADPDAPGPFAFADQGRVSSILTAGGWREVTFVPLDFRYVAGSGLDPVGDAVSYLSRIGPAARALRELPDGERAAFRGRLRDVAAAHREADNVTFHAAAWIVTARKA